MDDSLPKRIGASMPAILIGSALVVGLWLMPDLTPADAIPVIGQRDDHGRIVESLGADPTGLPRFVVEVIDGPDAGARIEALVQDGSASMPGSANRDPYAVGDEVVVTSFTGPAGGAFTVITEPWRLPLIGIAAALFALAVVVVGGLRGMRSLVALALTLTVVVKVVVPLLLRGADPILLAVGVAAAVTLATLLLTEGWSRVTLAAVLGTFAALALTAVLANAFTTAAEFTALQGNEEIAFLIPLVGDRIDLSGILLAATIVGALGVHRRRHGHPGGNRGAAPSSGAGRRPGRRHRAARCVSGARTSRRPSTRSCSRTSAPAFRSFCCSPSAASRRSSCSTVRSSRSR